MAEYDKYYIIPFKMCQLDDFTKRGLIIDKENENEYKNRICPDMEVFKDKLRVKNSYTDFKNRIYFSIMAT